MNTIAVRFKVLFLMSFLIVVPHLSLAQSQLKVYFDDSSSEFSIKEREVAKTISDDFIKLLNKIDQSVIKVATINQSNISFSQDNEIEETTFHINADNHKVEICFSSVTGFQNATYYLLNKMGFEFLGVSDNWLELPSAISLPTINQTFTPDIPYFTYFGTGGLGKFKTQKKLYSTYQYRNSLTNRLRIGHGYTDFYKKKKEEIDRYQKQGETIFRDYKGPKKDINEDSKEALELIKSYFEKKYLNGQTLLTISPKDGTSNQGTNSKNPMINNTVSKYLWIGNEVAKYLNQKYPNNKITFGYYAYGNGTGQLIPPNFNLETNLIIQIIPYAFQRDFKNTLLEKADVQAFKSWEFAFPNLKYSTYDYWNITQWSASLPQTNFFEIVPNRLSTWKENGLLGVTIESTYSSAITNPHFWVASQSAKGFEEKTIEQLYDDYFTLTFKDVSDEMRSFYELLSNWKGEISVCTAKQLLKASYSETSHLIVKRRIVELLGYMHFIDLSYSAKEINNASRDDFQRSLKLERWAKEMNTLGIIQTWGVYGYNYQRLKPYQYLKSPDKATDYLTNKEYNRLESIILNEINLDCQEISNLYYEYNLRNFYPKGKQSFTVRPYQQVEEYFFMPTKTQKINITIRNPTPTSIFEIKGDNGYYKAYKSTSDIVMNDLVEKGVSYQIKLGNRNDSKEISFDDETLYFVKSSSQTNGYRQNTFNFYVPNDLDEIVFKGVDNIKTKKSTDIIFNGAVLSPKKLLFKEGDIATFSIPTNRSSYDIRGQVVKIQSWRSSLRIVNYNPVLSRQEFIFAP